MISHNCGMALAVRNFILRRQAVPSSCQLEASLKEFSASTSSVPQFDHCDSAGTYLGLAGIHFFQPITEHHVPHRRLLPSSFFLPQLNGTRNTHQVDDDDDEPRLSFSTTLRHSRLLPLPGPIDCQDPPGHRPNNVLQFLPSTRKQAKTQWLQPCPSRGPCSVRPPSGSSPSAASRARRHKRPPRPPRRPQPRRRRASHA